MFTDGHLLWTFLLIVISKVVTKAVKRKHELKKWLN